MDLPKMQISSLSFVSFMRLICSKGYLNHGGHGGHGGKTLAKKVTHCQRLREKDNLRYVKLPAYANCPDYGFKPQCSPWVTFS